MAAERRPATTMPEPIRIIALDLDGTLLTTEKQLSPENLAALRRAAEAGIQIVPTTGRFYNGMPSFIRELPFIRYAITINGAEAADVHTGEIIYKSEIPLERALELMHYLDTLPVIYDCYQDNDGWISEHLKARIDSTVKDPHFRKMLHDLRRPVPELKAFVTQRARDVQKIQFFIPTPELRLELLETLPRRFPDLAVSSSVAENIEVNSADATKGKALLALAEHIGSPRAGVMAFGDGLNDLSMIRAAGIGVAMGNACDEAKAVADWITLSCDDHGVAHGIEQFCFSQL